MSFFYGRIKTSFELRHAFSLSDTRVVFGKYKSVKRFPFIIESFLDFKLVSRNIKYLNWSRNGFQEKNNKKPKNF